MPDKKLHAAALVTPPSERRRDRRLREAATRRIYQLDAAARRDEARARLQAERDEAGSAAYLPRGGEAGPAALRQYRRLRLPAHQDTSATLQGAYPFLAGGGLGSRGVFVGQDLYSGSSFVYDPWELYADGVITAPNVVLAGIVGSGKSSLAKSLYCRSIAFGRRVYIPCDPKGEHAKLAEQLGGKAIALGHGMSARLNPLDEGHRPGGLSDVDWRAQVASRRRELIGALAETMLTRALTPVEHTAVDVALRAVVTEAEVPMP